MDNAPPIKFRLFIISHSIYFHSKMCYISTIKVCFILTLKVKPNDKVYKVLQYVNIDLDKTPAKTFALGYVVNILSHSVNVSFRKASSVSNAVAWLRCCGLQGKHTFLSSTRRFVRITHAWGGTVLLQFPSDSQLSHSNACTKTGSPTLSTETKRRSEVWGVRQTL